MTAFDNALSPVALTLVELFGRTATLKIKSKTLLDAASPRRGFDPAFDQDITVTAAFIDFTLAEIQNTVAEMGDKRILIAGEGLTVDIDTQDQLIDNDGRAWKFVAIRKIEPGDKILLYEIVGRA